MSTEDFAPLFPPTAELAPLAPTMPLDLVVPEAPPAWGLPPGTEGPALGEKVARVRKPRHRPSGKAMAKAALVVLLVGGLITGASIYAVRQSRHIQALDGAWHAEGNRANAQTARADGLQTDLDSTKAQLTSTQSDLAKVRTDLISNQNLLSSSEATVSAQKAALQDCAHAISGMTVWMVNAVTSFNVTPVPATVSAQIGSCQTASGVDIRGEFNRGTGNRYNTTA